VQSASVLSALSVLCSINMLTFPPPPLLLYLIDAKLYVRSGHACSYPVVGVATIFVRVRRRREGGEGGESVYMRPKPVSSAIELRRKARSGNMNPKLRKVQKLHNQSGDLPQIKLFVSNGWRSNRSVESSALMTLNCRIMHSRWAPAPKIVATNLQ
jgi:hypothetical protein